MLQIPTPVEDLARSGARSMPRADITRAISATGGSSSTQIPVRCVDKWRDTVAMRVLPGYRQARDKAGSMTRTRHRH
jgi:ribosomal protein S7